jgi:transcriptional regulator with XRE-family HTH domain
MKTWFWHMNISDRIFEKLSELSMTQKEFSQKTGIRQSTISEWKIKHTNPSADKIMIICSVLSVSPEWLLSGTDTDGGYRNRIDWFVINRGSEVGQIIESYNQLSFRYRERLKGYLECLKDLVKEEKI